MKLQNFGPAELIVNSFLYSSEEEINEIRKKFKVYINNFDDGNFKDDKDTLLQNYNLLYDDINIFNHIRYFTNSLTYRGISGITFIFIPNTIILTI